MSTNIEATSAGSSQDSNREVFRQFLRQADKLIADGRYSEAKLQIADAKKLDPRNPFIKAFEERISLFEGKKGDTHISPAHGIGFENKQEQRANAAREEKGVEHTITRELLEQQIRNQIETEFKAKYTEELKKAEEKTARILENECKKLDAQHQVLKNKYEHLIKEARTQLESEFQQKLDEEVEKREDRLSRQHEAEIAFIEKELKAQLVEQHEVDLRHLEERFKKEQDELITREKRSFEQRENQLKDQFGRELLETLSRNESELQEQNLRQLDIERRQIEEKLTLEFGKKIADEKETLKVQFDELKTKLEEEHILNKNRLRADTDKKVEEQLEALRKDEDNKLDQRMFAIREELEKEFRARHERQIVDERERIKEESAAAVKADRKRLEEEFRKAEKLTAQQHKEDLASTEREIKAKLLKSHDKEMSDLESRFRKEREELLKSERRQFQENEQKLKDQLNKKMLEALRKTEAVFQEQNRQQIEIEREQIEKKLASDFSAKLAEEKTSMEHRFALRRKSLEEAYEVKQNNLHAEIDKRVKEQMEILRKIEEEKFEQNRIKTRKELETEFQKNYEEKIEEERKRIQDKADAEIESEKGRMEKEYENLVQKQNEQLQIVRSELRDEMEKTFLARLEQIALEFDNKMELLGAKIPELREDRLEFYKKKMLSSYVDGQPSETDAKTLMQLKELLEMTFDDHLSVESDVRLELYVRCVERKITAGQLDVLNADELNSIKEQFNISAEESARLEPYILSCFQRLATKGQLLVVDDDLLLLKMLEDLLVENGYKVVTAADVETALEKLENQSFDLILSDIKFGVGELDGFKFFKIVQEQPAWRSIPFIFMSALLDGVIIRSGVQLGVDDYITKPMDPDLLIATIEGKLKRFRSIQLN